MHSHLFTDDFKSTPYWWDKTPPPDLVPQSPPDKADVVIVGAGYTGLSAALQTARAGRHTVVIDAENVGVGCSTRNGGHISTSIKPGYDELSKKYGKERAYSILKEGHNALAWIEDFISHEGIDCEFEVKGKFIGAHNPKQYEKLAKRASDPIKGLEHEAYLIPKADQHSELGTDRYHGGIVLPNIASVEPAALHRGILDKVIAAGATIVTHCPATRIDKDSTLFNVETPKGRIQAKAVIIATNGYTNSATPWFRRRIIPIGSYIIATEPLAPELMDRLMPTGACWVTPEKWCFTIAPHRTVPKYYLVGVSHTLRSTQRIVVPNYTVPWSIFFLNSQQRKLATPGLALLVTPLTS